MEFRSFVLKLSNRYSVSPTTYLDLKEKKKKTDAASIEVDQTYTKVD